MATFIVGFAGASGSGKSTLMKAVRNAILRENLTVSIAELSADSYYKDLTHLSPTERDGRNFDHPDAVEWNLFATHLRALLEGHRIDVPIYSFITHTRQRETTAVEPASVILVDGILIFWPQDLRDLFHLKIFVDVEPDECLARRILRDKKERGREAESVIKQWLETVRPGFDNFVEPTKRHADIMVPRGGNNPEAVAAIAHRILAHTRQK